MNSTNVVLGAGPLGLATLEALQRQDVPTILVSRNRPAGLDPAANHAPLDLRDVEALAALLHGSHTAYFCAQPPYHRWVQEFASLQQSVLQACRRAGCSLVLADNLYAYGLPEAGQLLRESTPQRPTTRKGHVRSALADAALAAHRAGDVCLAILRGGGWGQVWHAPHQQLLSTRELLLQAASARGLPAPRIVREGRLALRLAGLFVPAAWEVIEMLPQFEQPYAVDDSNWLQQRSLPATPLPRALAATLSWFATGRHTSAALA